VKRYAPDRWWPKDYLRPEDQSMLRLAVEGFIFGFVFNAVWIMPI
jgi:hypothetical protein